MTLGERPATVIIVLLAGLWLALTAQRESRLQALDRPFYDAALARFGVPADTDEVTVVVVDDASLRELKERWPLERDTWARFIEKLGGYEPAVIAIDAWFERAAPRRAADMALDFADTIRDGDLGDLKEGEALATQLERAAALLDTDRRLAKAIADSGKVVLGVACVDDAKDVLPGHDQPPVIADLVPPARAVPCPRPSTSHPTLSVSARGQGGLAPLTDGDDVIRRYPVVMNASGAAVPSLALAALRVARPEAAEALLPGWLAVDGGAPRLRYAPIEDYRALRFGDVMLGGDDDALRSAFEDKIVFVGVSARGAEDHVVTPRGSGWPGVLVHVTGAVELLADRPLRREDGPAWLGALAGWLLLLGMAALTWKSESGLAPPALALGGSLAWLVTGVLALRAGWIIPVTPVLVGFAAWAVVKLVYAYLRGAEHRRRAASIRTAFQHYLAPTVVEALIEHPETLKLGGERRDITAFFSDVKGFTTISESMDPSDLVQLLNECLGAMTEVILDEGGTVDKYIGDAIVAMFGAPLDQPDHAERACRAALRCQQRMDALRPGWIARGKPDIRVRIGLNTGPAVVGNMGSEQRFDYTMLGDTVNLAARLEGANSAYNTWILAGESTVEHAGSAVEFRELDTVQLKGKQQGIRVYEVVSPGGARPHAERDARYAEGLAAWRARDWQGARAAFGPLAEAGDPPSKIFMERLAGIEQAPPPEDWGGVHVMTTK